MPIPTFSVLTVIIAVVCYSGFAQLQLNPNPLRLTNGATSGSVQISCGIPSGVTASTIYAIIISRYLKSAPTTEQSLTRADITVNQGQASLVANSGLTQNTATVSGSTGQKSMTLTLTQAKCEDAGTYVCKISYSASAGNSQIQNIDDRENFTVIVPPGNMTITADPQIEVGNYLVGEPITLTCNGMIGTFDPEIRQTYQWSWQYQDYESYIWTPYPNENDITMDPPIRGTSSCQYHQITSLTLYLTFEDSQRTYKCIVQASNNQGSSSAQYTLGIVAETELNLPTQAPTSSGNSRDTSLYTNGSFSPLQLIPNPLALTNKDSSGFVNISCGIPSGVTASSVNAISVSRYLKSAPTTEQSLARADVTVNQGQAALDVNSGLTQNTATVSGSTSEKLMELTLKQAKCEDAGTYVCKISYNAATGGNSLAQNIDLNENLTVTVLLGDISISISPDFPSYNVGNTVTISCDASIGSSNSGQEWIWEYRDGTGWHPYPEENNITKADPVSGAGSCQYYRQTCHLNRVISMEDNGRYYRCTVKRGSVSAATETIGIGEVEDHTTPATTTSKTVTTTKIENQVSSACGLANVLISFITSVSLAVMMPREI